MRISDWSSDVCSSDLDSSRARPPPPIGRRDQRDRPTGLASDVQVRGRRGRREYDQSFARTSRRGRGYRRSHTPSAPRERRNAAAPATPASPCVSRIWRGESSASLSLGRLFFRHQRPRRSEEHTSELQSLMRISYAVFCLKKKKYEHNKPHTRKQ